MGTCVSTNSQDALSLSDFTKTASHGDLILFSGNGFDSDIIRFFSNNKTWSHVGILIELDKRKYILESDRGNEFDFFTRRSKNGVRLIPIEKKIENYGGSIIGLKKLMKDDSKKPNMDYFLNTDLRKLLKYVTSFKYTQDILELYRSTIHGNKDLGSDFFCTKLVVHIYLEWGIFTKEKLSNNFSLNDLSEENGEELPFTRGFYFDDVQLLYID